MFHISSFSFLFSLQLFLRVIAYTWYFVLYLNTSFIVYWNLSQFIHHCILRHLIPLLFKLPYPEIMFPRPYSFFFFGKKKEVPQWMHPWSLVYVLCCWCLPSMDSRRPSVDLVTKWKIVQSVRTVLSHRLRLNVVRSAQDRQMVSNTIHILLRIVS